MIFVALTTTLFLASTSSAAPSTTKTINFQGRLMTAAGAVVPDGRYNMQFKIYQDGTGTVAGNPGGTLEWTESHINNGEAVGVEVKNGFFAATLGSVTPFGSSVDWNQDTLYLSMNIAGSASGCATFGSAPCAADGEMLPMKRITATPYSINSGAVGGKSVDELIQLGQGKQTDSTTGSSIFIDKTGTGNLLQLQAGGTDAFTLNNAGSITLGSATDQSLSVANSASGEGKSLSVSAGGAASGSNQAGGDVILQGGAGDGTGDSGNVIVKANDTDTTGTFQVQNTAGTAIFTVDTANSTISTGSLALSSDAIEAVDEITSTNDLVISSAGDMTVGPTSSALKLQGNTIDISASNGGTVAIQGGNATTSDTNGGSLLLSGGEGNGSGARGLVVLSTPTFSTVAADANCYTGGALVAASCSITSNTVNNAAAVLVGFSVAGQTATLPDPTITTAGRIMYVMAAGGSENFTLAVNGGGSGNLVAMTQNKATTLLWNGADWITAGGASNTSLQGAYDTSVQEADGAADITVDGDGGGLSIKESPTEPVGGSLLQVKDAASDSLLSVSSRDTSKYSIDGGANDSTNFTTNWLTVGGASVSRNTTDGQEGNDSVQVSSGTNSNSGVKHKLSISPTIDTRYRATAYIKLITGTTLTDYILRYSPDNGTTFADCSEYTITPNETTGWAKITCSIDTPSLTPTDPYLYVIEPVSTGGDRTYLLDNLSLAIGTSAAPSVKVGSDNQESETTLFTVDKSASAPTASDSEALLGSMYYDTTVGKLQCFEAEGWGACGSSPDIFVTISPEYANAVMNGADLGTITSDLCSDTLNINDGSSSQPTICGANETYNFYQWTTTETSDQTRSIYVTYQLPATFKEFAPGTTSLTGRTDDADAAVDYQVYRDSDTGLSSCGSVVDVSTGTQSTWQTATASGGADPSNCNFSPGDSIFFRINLTAANGKNAYVSNLNFIFSNN